MSAEGKEGECLSTSFGNVCWFEAPADDTGRASKFYSELFGWKVNPMPGPMEYFHLDTGGADAAPDGGLMKRQNAGHRGITMYIAVKSVDEASAKVTQLGGSICMPKTPVPGMGWFSIVTDTEGNTLGLWETEKK
jgi:predicted enzyme related to lactoylglutathione lyase